MTLKIFTVEQARDTLPLIGRITRDIVDVHLRLEAIKERVRKQSARFSRFEMTELKQSGKAARKNQGDRELAEQELKALTDELRELGCALLDGARGVVGYPAFIDNELVTLIWRYGDRDITTYCLGRENYKKAKPLPTEAAGKNED